MNEGSSSLNNTGPLERKIKEKEQKDSKPYNIQSTSRTILYKNNSFYYPDDIFPPVSSPFPGLPLSPQKRISKLLHALDTFIKNGQLIRPTDVAVSSKSHRDSESNSTPGSWPGGATYDENSHANLEPSYASSPQTLLTFNSNVTSTDIEKIFKWSRECLDWAENQPGLDDTVMQTVRHLVVQIAIPEKSSLPVTRFRGPALYLVGLWHLFGLFGWPCDPHEALSIFLQSAQTGYSRALYRIGSEVSFNNYLLHLFIFSSN